jgi:hypothetical protein
MCCVQKYLKLYSRKDHTFLKKCVLRWGNCFVPQFEPPSPPLWSQGRGTAARDAARCSESLRFLASHRTDVSHLELNCHCISSDKISNRLLDQWIRLLNVLTLISNQGTWNLTIVFCIWVFRVRISPMLAGFLSFSSVTPGGFSQCFLKSLPSASFSIHRSKLVAVDKAPSN